jgi:hypothetical protein
MAQQEFRVDLSKINFPLLSTEQGRTVVSRDSEELYHKQNNIPNMYFCQNVMPYKEGYKSVGFTSIIDAALSSQEKLLQEGGDFLLLEDSDNLLLVPGVTISDVRTIYSPDGVRAHLIWDEAGGVYSLVSGGTTWNSVSGAPAVAGTFTVEDITIGTVNSTSYIYYKNQGCYTIDIDTNTMSAQTLTGLVAADILGVLGSNGYLVAYTEIADFHSSLLDPTDFTPSQITGAGGGGVADIDGPIKFGVSHALGFMLYTEANVVTATYTGNKQYPFKHREVIGSRGGISLDLLAYEANSDSQFVFTTGGMQTISASKSSMILPEVTDFLSGKVMEDFDTTTLEFTKTEVAGSLLKKVKLIASRYLVISYGISEFTHALIYDVALDMLGKVKITHVDTFEYLGGQEDVAKQSLCFLLPTGEVKHLDFTTGSGVMIIGKMQYTRSRLTTLHNIEVENAESITVYDLPALHGKLLSDAVAGTPVLTEDDLKSFAFKNTAKNHNVAILGEFKANTVVAIYVNHGIR